MKKEGWNKGIEEKEIDLIRHTLPDKVRYLLFQALSLLLILFMIFKGSFSKILIKNEHWYWFTDQRIRSAKKTKLLNLLSEKQPVENTF